MGCGWWRRQWGRGGMRKGDWESHRWRCPVLLVALGRGTEELESQPSPKLLPAWLWALRRSLSGAGDRG